MHSRWADECDRALEFNDGTGRERESTRLYAGGMYGRACKCVKTFRYENKFRRARESVELFGLEMCCI